jgi:hypothetical protein
MIIIMETLARYNVRFEPDHTDVVVNEGTNLMEAAISAGVHINVEAQERVVPAT